MRTSNWIKNGMLVLGVVFAFFAARVSLADGGGGPSSGVSNSCRVQIGSHSVLFTAYQPQLAGTTPYCAEIPEVGKTAVVFDYEGKALRNMTVEFEITKEPEGTRVFYQPPETHPTGTFTSDVNFTVPGDYSAHITLVNEGQKVDEHIPFSIGEHHSGLSMQTYIVIAVVLIAIGYITYLSSPAFQSIVDRLLKKKSA